MVRAPTPIAPDFAVRLRLTRVLGYLLERFATSRLTAGIVARLVALVLAARINVIAKGAPNATVLLGLSRIRIQADATALAESGQFTVVSLPDMDQHTLQAAFFPSGTDAAAVVSDSWVAERSERFRAFLARMLPFFMRRIGAQAVIGANFWYRQDIHWGAAAQLAGFPYVVLFRESLKTSETEQRALIERCRRLGRFEGELILTHNETARAALLTSGYAQPGQVESTGALRLSRFIRRCLTERPVRRPSGARPTAALFSFAAGISLNALGIPPWPSNRYAGWVRLFERTHSAFAEAAMQVPDARFVIKTKSEDRWDDFIRQAIASRGMDLARMPNLVVTDKVEPSELMLESSVVISFASTVILEAGLAGKRVIIPDFEEALDPYYRQHLKLAEVYPHFEVARSPKDLVRLIVDGLRNENPIDPATQKERDRYFSLYVSSLRDDPLEKSVALIRRAIDRHAAAA